MQKQYQIAFVGAGKVAHQLAPELENAGHQVLEVYSRSKKNAKSLISRLYQADLKKDLDFSQSDAEIIFLTVSDTALAEVAANIKLSENTILVHTSGAQPIEKLAYCGSGKTGVFYPLQTFAKEKKIDFRGVPVFIESEDPGSSKDLFQLASSISNKVYQVKSDGRKAIHVAAVFAGNFSNYMMIIADRILKKEGLSFAIIEPLINETFQKALVLGPEKSLTGPAVRGDLETLDFHLEFLKNTNQYSEIYQIITQSILDEFVNK